MDKTIERKFTGKLSEFESKRERNISKKALKAYIKGKDRFSFGREVTTGDIQYYPTPQKIRKIK